MDKLSDDLIPFLVQPPAGLNKPTFIIVSISISHNDARHGILLGRDIYETFSKDLDLPVPIQHNIFSKKLTHHQYTTTFLFKILHTTETASRNFTVKQATFGSYKIFLKNVGTTKYLFLPNYGKLIPN